MKEQEDQEALDDSEAQDAKPQERPDRRPPAERVRVLVGLPTVFVISAIASAAAFAAGRSTSTPAHEPEAHVREATEAPPQQVPFGGGATALPPGHPATGPRGADDVPPGHPPIEPAQRGAPSTSAAPADTDLAWKVPPRWEVMPNTSSMRLATYRAPRAPGDTADADVSVMQAGGSVQANVDRWIGQFDEPSQKRAKRSTKKIAGLEVTTVELEGTFGGGMSGKPEQGWALLGAIVATGGMPHFFKITGPAKTVQLARPDLDALLATLSVKAPPPP